MDQMDLGVDDVYYDGRVQETQIWQKEGKKEEKEEAEVGGLTDRINKVIKPDSLALQIIPPDLFAEVDDFESGKIGYDKLYILHDTVLQVLEILHLYLYKSGQRTPTESLYSV